MLLRYQLFHRFHRLFAPSGLDVRVPFQLMLTGDRPSYSFPTGLPVDIIIEETRALNAFEFDQPLQQSSELGISNRSVSVCRIV